MSIRNALFIVLFVLASPAYASDVRITVAEVKDQRSTGEFFNTLEIKLRFIGDDSSSIRGVRTVISKAVDDTGRDLLAEDERKDGFETLSGIGSGKTETTLKLKNPARRAAVIRELAGEVQLFMPDRDPAATVLVRNFMRTAGRPLNDPALSKAGVAVTVLTKKEYDLLKTNEEHKAKEAAQKRGLSQELMSAFEGLLGAFFQVGENDLIFKISGSSGALIDLDVVDAAGAKIKSHGSMRSSDLTVLNYAQPVPPDARLRLFLKTQRSVVAIPLRLVDVALP